MQEKNRWDVRILGHSLVWKLFMHLISSTVLCQTRLQWQSICKILLAALFPCASLLIKLPSPYMPSLPQSPHTRNVPTAGGRPIPRSIPPTPSPPPLPPFPSLDPFPFPSSSGLSTTLTSRPLYRRRPSIFSVPITCLPNSKSTYPPLWSFRYSRGAQPCVICSADAVHRAAKCKALREYESAVPSSVKGWSDVVMREGVLMGDRRVGAP
ncbi:hypothetical protein K491DRAFT_193769 [Lophiostoma macrostomum CBS 122681]|uniref:Uncharacterized protein n=1 Tax=Lophiostoma macrostomum CBS 122681 TaxID=1314788 RepID=A0A6A6TLB8_9PLEO|nr:hypothetical protein K491DRAFT_193769 [Lophiostoma macrostomum CBS 122681]